MEKRVLIDTWQKVTRDDFLKFGTFPQTSFDTIVRELLIPDMAFAGFACVANGPAEVLVGNGHLYNLGRVYVNDSEGGTSVNLLSRLPAATKRICAITVWGTEMDSKLEPRTFLTDAETRATIARETATEHWRWANIGVVSGTEGPDPSPPTAASDVCIVAWVTLSTTGIEKIERNDAMYAPNLREEDNRLNEFDIWRITIGTLIDTLRSDLLALAQKIFGLAKYNLVREIAHDVGYLKEKAHLPRTYVDYDVDHFLTEDESDLTHVEWLARIEEGVRFPPAAGFDMQLSLQNQFDPGVIQSNFVLLPTWEPIARITNIRFDVEKSISQYQYQTIDMVQKTMSRQRTRYGTPFMMCSNTQWWQTGTFDWFKNTFYRPDTGETFYVLDLDHDDQWDYSLRNHGVVRLLQVWTDTVEEPYWERVVQNYAVSGAVMAQTFVNSQDGWVCEIDLYFSQVAASGDVTLLICELTNGSPDPNKILAQSTRTPVDLHVANSTNRIPTKFMFQPTYLKKDRYGFLVVSAGNHFLWLLKDTNFVSGTFFYSTDNIWFQGELEYDLAFEVYFCQFQNNMTRVQLQSLQLNGGIAAVDINANCIIPSGTQLFYEIQVNGVWHALDNVDGGPSVQFIGLPPLLPFRAVFVGTESLQPALGVAANSRCTTWRPRSDFKHISSIRTTPSNVTQVQADIRLEAWKGTPHHTFQLRLLYGGANIDTTTVNAASMVEEVAQDDPDYAIIRHYTFNVPATNKFRLRMDGTTDNVLETYHVAERFDIENPA